MNKYKLIILLYIYVYIHLRLYSFYIYAYVHLRLYSFTIIRINLVFLAKTHFLGPLALGLALELGPAALAHGLGPASLGPGPSALAPTTILY
jgi:hypothetical protein